MQVYEPAEDSYFLAKIVKDYVLRLNNKDILVLDMGTGSGIQSDNIIKLGIKKKNILAVDVNQDALNYVKRKLKVKTLKSNLFEKVKGKYFLVLFNPPYLAEDKYDKMPDTTGGKNGDETIIRFIKQIKKHLVDEGVCFLLTSSYTPEKTWKLEVKKQKLKVKKIAKKALFYEKLYIWEIKK